MNILARRGYFSLNQRNDFMANIIDVNKIYVSGGSVDLNGDIPRDVVTPGGDDGVIAGAAPLAIDVIETVDVNGVPDFL